MNYLAHLLLSGDDPDWQLGGLLGDFIKGPLPDVADFEDDYIWPSAVLAGLHLHRQIDSYVDNHPQVLRSRKRLGPNLRRLGGIVLDVTSDHFLARHWQQFNDEPLTEFEARTLAYGLRYQPLLPDSAHQFLIRASANRLLSSYVDPAILQPVFTRIAKRSRFHINLHEAAVLVMQNYTELESDFMALMPELQQFARERRQLLLQQMADHP